MLKSRITLSFTVLKVNIKILLLWMSTTESAISHFLAIHHFVSDTRLKNNDLHVYLGYRFFYPFIYNVWLLKSSVELTDSDTWFCRSSMVMPFCLEIIHCYLYKHYPCSWAVSLNCKWTIISVTAVSFKIFLFFSTLISWIGRANPVGNKTKGQVKCIWDFGWNSIKCTSQVDKRLVPTSLLKRHIIIVVQK